MANEFLSFQEWMESARKFQKTPEQSLEALGFSPEGFADFSQRATDAFTAMVSSPEADETLSRFRYAVDFRSQDGSFIETRRELSESDRIAGALDKAFSLIGFPAWNLIPDNKVSQIDDEFRGKLVQAFPDAVAKRKGLVHLALSLSKSGIPLESAQQPQIAQALDSGLRSYWDRTPVQLFVEAA